MLFATLCGGPDDGRRIGHPTGGVVLIGYGWTNMRGRYVAAEPGVYRFRGYAQPEAVASKDQR